VFRAPGLFFSGGSVRDHIRRMVGQVLYIGRLVTRDWWRQRGRGPVAREEQPVSSAAAPDIAASPETARPRRSSSPRRSGGKITRHPASPIRARVRGSRFPELNPGWVAEGEALSFGCFGGACSNTRPDVLGRPGAADSGSPPSYAASFTLSAHHAAGGAA